MNIKKLHKKIDNAISDGYDKGYDVGYDSGYEAGYSEAWTDRFENVTYRLNSLFNTYMSTNKLRDAKMVKEIAEYLDFFVTLEDEDNG